MHIITKITLLCLFFTCFISVSAAQNQTIVRIYQNATGSWLIDQNATVVDYIAEARYNKTLETLGWDFLAITTNKSSPDELQAEAAGRIEGYLTAERIWNHFRNLNAKTKWRDNNTHMPEYVQQFFIEQEKFVVNSFNSTPEDPMIRNAYLIVKQFNGLIQGYNTNVPAEQQIPAVEFHTMASFGDLFDVVYYNSTHTRPDFESMSAAVVERWVLENSHCSALFKVKDDFSDIFFGHNSWFVYSAMNRIFKEYNFNFNHSSVKSRNIMFSSYPATLASNDDFYLTSQDLAVIETTNPFFNNTLYDLLTPNSLLCWQRAMIANRISTSAEEWTQNFAKYNSGTYNNMFMAFDMKRVDLVNKTIGDKAFMIVEQIPGSTDINDVTPMLKYGYWPSYNSPYSQSIRKASGIQEMINKKPELIDSLDYSKCTRANIFRRDHGKVSDVSSFKSLIRYNDYLHDPFSLGKPTGTISARGDLDGKCFGAYDAKVGSVSQTKGQIKTVNIISGPTYDTQPAFSFSKANSCDKDPRFGLSDEWKFAWVDYTTQYPDIYSEMNEESYALSFLS